MNYIREAFKKKISQKVEKVQRVSSKKRGGGGHIFIFFPKFKKVKNILGEGGDQENSGLFPLFVKFF